MASIYPKIITPKPTKCEGSTIKDYTIIKELNSGTFSNVYLIRNTKTKDYFAAKVIKNLEDTKLEICVKREINILFQIRHPTIIEFKGYFDKDFNGDNKKTILMQYLSKGSLLEIIQLIDLSCCPDDYGDTQRQIILIGIARGMMLLHEHKIIHRDLKLGNILLEDDYSPRITDFNLSKFYDPEKSKNQSICNIGTLAYMAPEVIKGCEYDIKADIYSFGILMYEIIYSIKAYDDIINKTAPHVFEERVMEGLRPELSKSIKPVKENIKNLIQKCWSSDISERPTFSEIYQKLSNDKNFWLDDVDEGKIYSYIEKISVDIEKSSESTKLPFNVEGSIPVRPPDSPKPSKISPRALFQQTSKKNKEDYNLIYKHVCTDTIDELRKFLSETISKTTNVNKFYTKMRNFLDEEFIKSNEGFYFFNYDEEYDNTESITEPEIYIKNYLYQKLIDEDCFIKPEFIDVLKEFNKVYIEINSDSNYFESELGIVLKLRDNEKCNVAASVVYDTITNINPMLQIYNIIEIVNLERLISNISFLATFEDCHSFKNIIFCKNCPSIDIGSNTFKNCKSFRNFAFNNKIKSIGDNAFKDCISCEKVCCPTIIYKIGKNAFRGCYCLKTISFDYIGNLELSAFEDCTSLINININWISNINSNAFKTCYTIREINIKSINVINSNAFEGCTSLTKLNIDYIGSINSYAFKQCKSLKEINSIIIDKIMSNAFDGCISIKELNVGNINYIDSNVFKGFTNLKKIKCKSIGKIMTSAFEECTSLTTIDIEKIDLIDSKAFKNCSSLIDIKNKEINKIMSNAFEDCISIKEIKTTINEIGSNSFKNCKSLELFSIDNYKLNSIEESVFEGCLNLEKIIIDEYLGSIIYIKKAAFKGCSSLKEIDALFKVEIIEESAFENCRKLNSFDFSLAKEIKSRCFACCSSFQQISIPNTITYIPTGAFCGCSSLKTLFIPISVTTIDDDAFRNCTSLVQVRLPKTLKKIGSNAFNFCMKLNFISIPSSVKSIGANALNYCSELKGILISSSLNPEKIGIAKSVTINNT